MKDLIERLEKAAGPDDELDARVACLAPRPEWLRGDNRALVASESAWVAGHWTVSAGANGPSIQYPKYTASIDAALTLVPEGWQWQASNRAVEPHAGRAYLNNKELICIGGGLTRNPKYRGAETTAATPAIALCIAALKAREAH